MGLAYLFSVQAAVSQTVALSPDDTASIIGRVVDARSGQPIKNAQVALRPVGREGVALSFFDAKRASLIAAEQPAQFAAKTDALGYFRLTSVVVGDFTLSAQKAGYLRTNYGSTGPGELGAVIAVRGGPALDLSVPLLPSGAITGRISNAQADAFDDGVVQLLSTVWMKGRARNLVVAQERPDDLGSYRFGKLSPGKYYVVFVPQVHASGKAPPVADLGSRLRNITNPVRTFFPAAAKFSAAVPVIVELGAEEDDININVQGKTLYDVRGRVAGHASGESSMGLVPEDEDLTAVPLAVAEIQSDGSFQFFKVSPGAYNLIYRGSDGVGSSLVHRLLEISDADVNEVSLQVPPPTIISGKIEMDSREKTAYGSQIAIGLSPADDLIGAGATATSNADGTFRIEGCGPGRYVINVRPPSGFYVRTITTSTGVELLDGTVRVEGVPVQLNIALRSGSAQVEGTIKPAAGDDTRHPAGRSTYYAMIPEVRPADGFGIRFGRTDSTGYFRIPDLPPARYQIFAFESPNLAALENPAVMRALNGMGRAVDITEHARVNIIVPLVPSEQAASAFGQDR
jgi:hypothetical protein